MNIFISNDDGIESNGLKELAERLAKKHNVLVVAPDGNRSALSHSLSIRDTLKLKEYYGIQGCKAYSLSGTPADCVKFSKLHFADFKSSVVVAGINKGHNIGSDILYSGTVGIACEGAFFGDISFAFSVHSLGESDFNYYAKYAEKIFDSLIPLSKPGDIWNINFPPAELGEIKGIKVTPLGKQLYTDKYVLVGNNEYRLTGEIIEHDDNDKDCDIEWSKKGYVTITPILFNKTDYTRILEVKNLCER
jgi:5'-nucleotidase